MYRPFAIEELEQPEEGLNTPINQNFHPEESDKVKRYESILTKEYWDYREKWVKNPIYHILGWSPLNLDLEITNNCNLKCTMCPRTDMVDKGTFWDIGKIDFDTYKRIIDEGVANGLCALKYNYMGEPLMHPDLIEMIKYAKQAGVVDVFFNTNAVLLTEDMAQRLVLSGLDKLFFSFDSPYREKFNQIRVGADYDRVLHNIKRFHEIRDEMGSIKPLTRVTMVVMEENQNEWPAFRDMFKSIVDIVAHSEFLSHVGMNQESRMVIPPRSRDAKYCCPQLWQRMIVHPDGVATACCVNSNRSLEIGNIKEQSLSEIWTGEKHRRLCNLHASGRFDEIPACAVCPLANYGDLV